MYRDVMSMVKISLPWPEKLKSRIICSACVLSLMYDGKDSADLTTMSLRLLRFLSAAHSSEERLENLVYDCEFCECRDGIFW